MYELWDAVYRFRPDPIPEVAGDAAEYVDLADPGSLASSIRQVERGVVPSENPAGVRRAREHFSPERFADGHRRVYEDVLAE